MNHLEIQSPAFQLARLRSERARVLTLLGVFGGLLLLVLIRGGMSLLQGYRGEAWPFAILLAAMIAYEVLWLRFVDRAIERSLEVPTATWTRNIFVESLFPTIVLLLQIYTPFTGPERTLTSPAVLAYFLFIILSTLHLNPDLSRLSGAFAAAGYGAIATYIWILFPQVAAGEKMAVYGAAVSYAALLLLGGFAAGAVAGQIRQHVIAALHEVESRAKIAQLEHDLGVARSIQQGLLPKAAPDVTGFDIAGWNRAADETGGDYFDWQQLPDGRVAVTVGDVTGHGIGSALCMAACRAYARAGFATSPDLRILLCRMNQLLHEDLPAEKFVTLAVGLLDHKESTLQLISAGHGPLLFYSSTEDCFRTYEAQGLPLGLMPRANYSRPQPLRFERGDMLVLVTDGFVEWANGQGEDFGEDRVKEVVRANRLMPSATIISELYLAVSKFAGTMPQLDDLTALIVKRV
jgi:serine phosphatase RsbU (regulator of sigma subunit)